MELQLKELTGKRLAIGVKKNPGQSAMLAFLGAGAMALTALPFAGTRRMRKKKDYP